MIKFNYRNRRIAVIILCAVMLIFGLFGNFPIAVRAEDAAKTEYSDVLDDLQSDKTFNADEYPAVEDDYTISVIHIAEGINDELFVYTYQPCQEPLKLTATDINMSITQNVEDTELHGLDLINRNGVFAKYRVKDITVSDAETRYYILTSIYRKWDKDIDEPASDGNKITEVAFPVGRYYSVTTNTDGTRSYSWQKEEIVKITDKYVGQISYSNGHKWIQTNNTTSHYVAFSTDWQIDYLLEAKVSYSGYAQNMLEIMGEVTEFQVPVSDSIVIKSTEFGENTAEWFAGKKHKWRRIERVSDFVSDPENALKDGAKKALDGKQWVLRFKETTFNSGGSVGSYTMTTTYITDISILEFTFLTGTTVYTVGVVDNKQTGSGEDDNTNTDEWDLSNGFLSGWNKFINGIKKIMSRLFGWILDDIPDWSAILFFVGVVIVGVILLVILIPFMPFIGSFLVMCFKGLGKGLFYLFKGLVYVLSLPVRGIIALIQRKRDE